MFKFEHISSLYYFKLFLRFVWAAVNFKTLQSGLLKSVDLVIKI